jgi:hypothetical protein
MLEFLNKFKSRKFWFATVPWVFLFAVWEKTGQVPDWKIVVATMAASAVYLVAEALIDRDALKYALLIGLALFASGTAFADTAAIHAALDGKPPTQVDVTPRQRALEASGIASQIVFTGNVQILCQNNLSTIEAALNPTSDCCARLDECRKMLERSKVEQNLPFDQILNSMVWYSKMPRWAKLTVAGTVSAIIIGATTYLGTVSK